MKKLLISNAFDYCEAVCREASTTFFSSFSALQPDKRKAVHAVYALCRWVDDIVDGDEEPMVIQTPELQTATERRHAVISAIHHDVEPTLNHDEYMKRLMALVDIRIKLQLAERQQITHHDHPIFIALQDVFTNFPIKINDFETVIEGMEDDLYPVRNRSWDELRSYCYKVASAVGLILIEIYGYEDRAARLHAIDLGIQMQLVNVLRDVNEDLARGRIYLPTDILLEHGINPSDLGSPDLAKSYEWRNFVHEYTETILRHQSSAQLLFPYLDSRARVQPQIMADAYSTIFTEIVRRSGDVFSQPVKLSSWRKIRLGLRMQLHKIRARFS